MKKDKKYFRKEIVPVEHSYAWSMTIGIVVGFLITLLFGISLDNIAVGIATGPALGVGIGFAIHGFLNRNGVQLTFSKSNSKKTKSLIALLVLGMLLILSVYIYLMN